GLGATRHARPRAADPGVAVADLAVAQHGRAAQRDGPLLVRGEGPVEAATLLSGTGEPRRIADPPVQAAHAAGAGVQSAVHHVHVAGAGQPDRAARRHPRHVQLDDPGALAVGPVAGPHGADRDPDPRGRPLGQGQPLRVRGLLDDLLPAALLALPRYPADRLAAHALT